MTFQEIEDWHKENRVENSSFWNSVGTIINGDGLPSDKRRALCAFAKEFFVEDCKFNHARLPLHRDRAIKLYALCSDSGIDTEFAEFILKSKLPKDPSVTVK